MYSNYTTTMSSALVNHDNLGLLKESSSGRLKQYMKSSSSLSTDSSDFEFDSCSFPELNDEPPISPKLNYSPNWESAVMISTTQDFANREITSKPMNSTVVLQGFDDHATFNVQYGAGLVDQIRVNDGDYGGSLPRGKSEYAGGDAQITEGEREEFSSSRGRLGDLISTNDGIKGDNYGGEERKRMNLRSLLHRRELEQLSPLQKLQVSSSPSPSSSASSSSSPFHHHADHSPCRNHEDHQAEPTSTPKSCRSCHEKKSRKWAFNLDFLRRTVPSSRSDHHLNHGISSHAEDYRLNHSFNGRINHNCRIVAAAAEEARIDDQRFEHYSVAAEAAEITKIESPRHAAAVMNSKFESPRKSTGSISNVNSAIKNDNDVIKALKHDNEAMRAATRKVSRSAPISPAASPPRSSGGGGGRGAGSGGAAPSKERSAHTRRPASPRWAAPMSPHARHYEQQKARAEELRRRTFLPYRQSLLSACFFPADLHSSPPPAAVAAAHHPQQPAVVF